MSKSYKVFLLVRKITEKKREMYIIIRINFHFWKISRKCVSIHSVKFTPPIANVWRFFILGTKKTRLPEHWWLNQPAKVGVEQIYWQYSKWVWSQFTVNVIWSKLLTLRHILPIQQTYIYIALIFFFSLFDLYIVYTDWLRPELKTEWAFHVSFECMFHFGGRLDSQYVVHGKRS